MRRSITVLAILTLSACAPAAPTASAPVPVVQATNVTVSAPPAVELAESPVNWQLSELSTDGILGIGSDRALSGLLAGRSPERKVIVAVIDGGVDTAHTDLKPVLWKNTGEMGNPGRDDDNNGYADDVHGWNFIGNKDGRNIHYDTFEITRLYSLCSLEKKQNPNLSTERAAECSTISDGYNEMLTEVSGILNQIGALDRALTDATRVLAAEISGELTVEKVQALQTSSPQITQAKQIYAQLSANGINSKMLEEAREAYSGQIKYGLDTLFNPRDLVGDNISSLTDRIYGNNDISGPDAKHGSHVAGIIAAVRGNGIGLDGVTNGVEIMGVRAVPDGDERDKDVANAIRYATDNGAHIINMSFGKSYSPDREVVDEAVKYAISKGVLLIHAAGNDGANIDTVPNFPTAYMKDGTVASLWLEVGASSWKGGHQIAAGFSNYGKERVDLFAPGEDIYSSVPGDKYERQSGTSMAAPVVSGVAALLMAYYPELTAQQVKHILLTTVTRFPDNLQVVPPGGPPASRVPFNSLSSSGGVVNAYEAVKMAERMRSSAR